MAWSTPPIRLPGEKIEAGDWNQDVKDNTQFLHDRTETMWVTAAEAISGGLGDYPTRNRGVGNSAGLAFHVPDDFDALVSIHIVISHSGSGTFQYDLVSDYCKPGSGEDYNYHSESALNLTTAVTANKPIFIDASGVFQSLAAGDVCGVVITNDGVGGSGTMYVFGLRLMYTRI